MQLDIAKRWRADVRPALAARPLRLRGVEPYLYLLPALSLTILWTYWPVLGTVQLAFYQWNLLPTTPRIWVGLENFEQLFRLPELGQAVGNHQRLFPAVGVRLPQLQHRH